MLCEPVFWSQKELVEVSYTQVINYNHDVCNMCVTYCVLLGIQTGTKTKTKTGGVSTSGSLPALVHLNLTLPQQALQNGSKEVGKR